MRRRSLSLAAALVVAGCALEVLQSPRPLLVWNVTESAPLGLYRRSWVPPKNGDWMLLRPPRAVAELAAARHYLPRNVPMVKRIAASSGDTVCRAGVVVRVNGEVRAVAQARDRAGRLLPRWSGCARLHGGQFFVLNAPALSFDSRYFGAVDAAQVIERIEPLWTF